MAAMHRRNAWLRVQNRDPNATRRLFCFPYLGGSAESFDTWSSQLKGVEVVGVQLPGHGTRHDWPPLTDWSRFIRELSREVGGYLASETAFFGHGLGAILAFEVARELRRRGAPLPAVLFLSGLMAPQDFRLPRETSEEDVLRLMDSLQYPENAVIKAESEARWLALPVIQSDLALFSNYAFLRSDPLDCEFHCVAGAGDPIAPPAAMKGWIEHTRGDFHLQVFQGGHYFLDSSSEDLLEIIGRRMNH